MINDEKWVKTLPRPGNNSNTANNQIDHDIWVNTIAKKDTNHPIKKYSSGSERLIEDLIFK